jgi:two-component system response regulator YesN
MLRETERFLKKIKEEVEKRSSKPVRQAQSYIENNYREKILLEDVACIVGLNPIYFSTLFKKETGTNFSQYLVNIRLEKAKELLTSTNQTIGAIAEEVGYKDIKYFSQLFSKNVGIKPAVYRKLHL